MTATSKASEELRVRKIRNKFGVNCFRNWGKRGGNEVLIAQREGRVTIRKKPHKRK